MAVNGGNSSSVAAQLNGTIDVTQIYSTYGAFAALRSDGSVVTWGNSNYGGDSSAVASQLDGTIDITQIYSTYGDTIFNTSAAFAALRNDGSVVTWGGSNSGGDSSAVASQLDGTIEVAQIYSTYTAFAALRSDGSVVTWGNYNFGGNSSEVAAQIDGTIDVTQIYSTIKAFAALRSDGSVVTWGASSNGGDSSAVAAQLNGTIDVTQIYSTYGAFAALLSDGSVVTWGNSSDGGDSSAVATQLDGTIDVTQIYSTDTAFAALRSDGSIVTWGDSNYGGDSSAVAAQLDSGVVSGANIYTNDVFTASNYHAPAGSVTIKGIASQGKILTAANTLADADGLGTIGYTWKTGATVLGSGNTYTLKAADVGKTLTVTASYTDGLGNNESVSSAATGVVGITSTGSAQADSLFGTSGDDSLSGAADNDVLVGDAGNDVLTGGSGNDVLVGEAGNDILDGGIGNDTLLGGAGNDTYTVDASGDVVAEASAAGKDTIKASIGITLAANVENLTLTGSADINGTGNGLANTLIGNNANNVLSGGTGNDTLDGGLGNDTLSGGAGKDVFRFTTAPAANIDNITDFVVADDTIKLENAIFTKLSATGVINNDNFKIGTVATDANDYLVYDQATGALFYDADGNGAGVAVQIALLGTHPALTNADFVVI